VDANIINPFLQATLKIIRDVAHLSYKVEKIYIKKDENGCGDVTGIIGLSGSGKGTVAVTFDQSTIIYIVSKILEMESNDIDEDIVIDTVGELANMITGCAVSILTEKGYDLDLTVPTVVHGPEHKVVHQTDGPKIVIPYSSKQGNFTVEFSFDKEMKKDDPEPPPKTETKTSENRSSDSKRSGNKVEDTWGMPPEEASTAEEPENQAIANWGVPEND
jgi:chemotaxis protein CheX